MTSPLADGPTTTDGPVTLPYSPAAQQSWVRTRMGIERTLMSWNRTALSLVGFGLTIYKTFEKLHEAVGGDLGSVHAARNIGLALILTGTIGSAVALWQYLQAQRYLAGPEFSAVVLPERQPGWGMTFGALAFTLSIGAASLVWILTG